MKNSDQFPLRGVIGVVSESSSEIELALDHQLQCVEIRADLLLDQGLSQDDLIQLVKQSKAARLACLVTLRHPDQGGRFQGSEQERVEINRRALEVGADIIDLEWGTAAATTLMAEKAPMILSYHDFNGMPDEVELATLTENMISAAPLAIKIVPTASTLDDAVRMLRWVDESDCDGKTTRRIGFAMGAAAACSRILTTAFGGPVTYTSFGEPVAPGQIALPDLINLYRVADLDSRTTLTAVIGNSAFSDPAVVTLNHRYQMAGDNRVAIAFPDHDRHELEPHTAALRISEILSELS